MKTRILILMSLTLIISFSSFAQKSGKKYYITGQVLDMNDKPVSGAMILVDNKSSDVTTNDQGMYKVKVKADAATISIVSLSSGLLSEEINGRINIDFKLDYVAPEETVKQENTEDEAIDIGYGTVRKKHMVTSNSKITGQNRYAHYNTVYEMLKAEVPGVIVEGNNITIRGIATINSSTAPLVFVNGVEVSAYDIPVEPAQVKSLNVLKGPEAAIYGSRGANGVILITLIGK